MNFSFFIKLILTNKNPKFYINPFFSRLGLERTIENGGKDTRMCFKLTKKEEEGRAGVSSAKKTINANYENLQA